MAEKNLPFTLSDIERIASEYPTPFFIYDEAGIRENARNFNSDFSALPGFRNYFALKALPTASIMQILSEEGMGADCSSLYELEIANCVGLKGEQIMFTSNNTPAIDFQRARELGAIINLDDIGHINFLEKHAGIPGLVGLRYNPGDLILEENENGIIGKGREQKFGITTNQVLEAYKILLDKGVERFGLHAMVVSNQLDPKKLIENYKVLFEAAARIHKDLGINTEFIDLGGGIGIPYKPGQIPVNRRFIAEELIKLYDQILTANGISPKIYMECGRAVTGPHGYLVSKVRHLAEKYKVFVGMDSTAIADLPRYALYEAYHHITVLGKEDASKTNLYDVTGSLCENNDMFAKGRALPEIQVGETLSFHDAGAHCRAMGSNYNSKPRSGELLLKPDKSVRLIRRTETLADIAATDPLMEQYFAGIQQTSVCLI